MKRILLLGLALNASFSMQAMQQLRTIVFGSKNVISKTLLRPARQSRLPLAINDTSTVDGMLADFSKESEALNKAAKDMNDLVELGEQTQQSLLESAKQIERIKAAEKYYVATNTISVGNDFLKTYDDHIAQYQRNIDMRMLDSRSAE